jgi:hypothetical protein
LARSSHSRSNRGKARKETGGTPQENGADDRADGHKDVRSDGGGVPASASIDGALDRFLAKAHSEFHTVAPNPSTASAGTYHPAPSNPPLRWLGIGVLLGMTVGIVGVLLALALSR